MGRGELGGSGAVIKSNMPPEFGRKVPGRGDVGSCGGPSKEFGRRLGRGDDGGLGGISPALSPRWFGLREYGGYRVVKDDRQR